MLFYWEVTGNNSGRQMVEEVKAHTQSEARDKFSRLNPGYTPGRAQRLGRA